MAKVIEISCSVSVRVNLGDYQGKEFFMSRKAELDELDDPAEEQDRLMDDLEAEMGRRLQSHHRARGKDISPEQIRRRYGVTDKG